MFSASSLACDLNRERPTRWSHLSNATIAGPLAHLQGLVTPGEVFGNHSYDFDLITVGGDLGGAVLAKKMAESGAQVLVLEARAAILGSHPWRMGRAPWGVAEAQEIGVY